MEKVEDLETDLLAKAREASAIKRSLTTYEVTERQLEEAKKAAKRYENAGAILEKWDRLAELKTERTTIEDAINKIETSEMQIKETKDELEQKQNELAEIMPDVCPFCGSEVIA